MVTACTALADELPVISAQPQSCTRQPGQAVTFTVESANASSFQWRCNGTNIPGATASTLSILSPTTADAGYYVAVAKNATGWVPSQPAYLAVVSAKGLVPFYNDGIAAAQVMAQDGAPVNNGTAQLMAGPTLDQMQPVPKPWPATGVITAIIANGYYRYGSVQVPTVAPSQTVYYRVDVSYTSATNTYARSSRVLTLIAGGGEGYPVPSLGDLRFPYYIEWPDPFAYLVPGTPTNQVRIPGETFSLSKGYYACYYFGHPQFQWRRDGVNLPGATDYILVYDSSPYGGVYQPVLTITNAQASDAGNYDVIVNGSYCFVDVKTTLSMQLTNGPGVLSSPRRTGSQFMADLLGVPGRNYTLQWSSNFSSWNDLQTLSNVTATVTFTNSSAVAGARFYRVKLLP